MLFNYPFINFLVFQTIIRIILLLLIVNFNLILFKYLYPFVSLLKL